MSKAIEFVNVGKQYRLGRIGTGTLQHDLNRWWQTTIMRKPDPYLLVGETNDRAVKGKSDYVWALKDISFSVEEGDVVGIIGKNGSGKSTLLKLLSHITAPSTGKIYHNGRIASLLEVGTGFHPEMTARENIFMNGSIMGMTRHEIQSKLDEIVDFAGIERYLETPVKRFSSGMTVRLGFAVAAFLEPEILVVDEVLAVGDAEFQKKAIGKMKEVSQGGGRTVLFVSHNMASISRLCKTGILLENGQLSYMGTAEDAIHKYMAINSDEIDQNNSIANRTSRHGSGLVHVNDVKLLDKEGHPVSEIILGEFLEVKFFFSAKEGVDLTKLIIACGFEDHYGIRANEWISDEMDHDFKNGITEVSLKIPALLLRPNKYFFHFKFAINTTEDRDVADEMHFVKQLNVLTSSFFADGIILKGGRGYEAFMPAFFD